MSSAAARPAFDKLDAVASAAIADATGSGGVEVPHTATYLYLSRILDSGGLSSDTLCCFLQSLNQLMSGSPINRVRKWLQKQRRLGASPSLVPPSPPRADAGEHNPLLLPTHLPPAPDFGPEPKRVSSKQKWLARQAGWTIVE